MNDDPATPAADEAAELLEVLDASGEPTGEFEPREVVHRQGLWHRTLHLWLVCEHRGVPHVLMQRRSGSKDLEPNKLDVAVGGHFRAGESLAAGLREAEEELGLTVRLEELVYLGRLRAVRVYPHAVDREVQETYVLRRDAELDSYALHLEEVAALYALPLAGAVALYAHGTPLTVSGVNAHGRRVETRLTPADLIAGAREDTLAVLRRLQADVAGEPES